MSTELLTSKLYIPPLRTSLVPRPRLIQLLNEGLYTKRKLTLISAPAGFGKTTLVVDWLNQANLPAAWLSLDEADNDLPRFLAYLAAAFQQVDEGIGASVLNALQSQQPLEVQVVLTGLLNEITTRTDPLVLVLDDFHQLTKQVILEGFAFMLVHQPQQLHILVTTREDPDLPLARLRARDQLNEIRAADLRFTQEEADNFLRCVMGLAVSEQDVAALEGRTEGWAVGLQLAGLSMQKQADLKSFIAEFSGSHRHILDYLTEEVIQQQPGEIQSFLLQTSILDRLSGSLCDALTERNDSDKLLRRLEIANLFLVPLDEERRWYRYHHLFSDLLQNQLNRTHAEWLPMLHRRASCWYDENGYVRAAVEHALLDTDLSQAARLIEQHSIEKLYQGQIAMVVGWFDRLPAKMLESAPMLCINKAWALTLTESLARQAELSHTLQQAAQALDQVGAGKELRDLVAGHIASIRAFLQQSPDLGSEKAAGLIALFEEAQRLLPMEEKAIRSVNALNIGYGYMDLVDLEAAFLAFTQTLEDGLASGNFYAAIYGPISLVLIARLRGDLRKALKLCNTNIDRFNQALAGQIFTPIGALYILKGIILYETDHLAESEQALVEGLDLVRWNRDFAAHSMGEAALARLRALQGDRPAMAVSLQNMEDAWRKGDIYAQSQRHRLLTRYWLEDPQVQKGAHAWLSQSGINFAEMAVISSVKPTNELYFQGYLGAAHVLACLAKSKPDTYDLESVHAYLRRQGEYAETHGIVSWFVSTAIARTVLFEAVGKKAEALNTLSLALSAAVNTGFFRTFVDEGEPMQALLAELRPRLKDEALIAYANLLLGAFGYEAAKIVTPEKQAALLSERELEVLQSLSHGLSYEEIGQQLFLSLNTIQFHIKNIYRKLLVNKRVQAIEKARELKLI